MTSQESLNFHKAAFLDLFDPPRGTQRREEPPDLARFLRLVISVLDPDPGYGPAVCGGGDFGPTGCGRRVLFKTHVEKDVPIGFTCLECGAIYPFSMYKPPRKAASRVVLESTGESHIGRVRSTSGTGNVLTDEPKAKADRP